ncbi:peroxisome targeting signal receptor [Gymnopilus junonius]|uniref:Peroxisome targeting signal receptor n=1 Tax=Gymnopilus junonius TaxID=109634 RepID=A0A9P5TQV2_GYMJU|nr:peroxisome targeting signal receptor [Gymnopilus junonius]
MSFQALVSGSECAAPANPLSQVLKHAEGDRSLQQDRLAGPSTSRLHHLPGSSSSAQANEQDLALARQFFEGSSAGHGMTPGFSMQYPAEFSRMREANPHLPMNESWVIEQQQQMRAYEETAAKAAWAAEFGAVPQTNSSAPMPQANASSLTEFSRPNFMPSMYGGSPMGIMRMGPPTMQYGVSSNLTIVDQGKGKGREADFEAAFAQIAASLAPAESQTSRVEEVSDDVAQLGEALQAASLKTEEGESGLDFQRVWDQLQNSDLPPPKEDMAKWEAEFSQMMNAQRDELEDFGTGMQNAWEGGLGNFDDVVGSAIKFDGEGIPMLGDYVFEQHNKYMDLSSSRSLLNDAKLLLENNGSLSEAALMLEAAIQQGELGEGGYEAWILLGETRNMDEREEAGMRALLQGVQKAEEAGAAGAGMLSLAISFTNESYDRASHTMLLRWFRARYPNVVIPEETIKAVSTNSAWDTHDRITELFLDLARTQHAQDTMDADLQIALGVLFYNNADYERAQDCFAAALNVRPKDYLLWNRLGSSLSNGNKPEEALGAYREALQLRPTYTRAIYNVGVACLNIGADKEAAEHFLSALSLQESTNGDTSDQLWFTLRRALLSMKRSDLADLAKPESKSNLDVFRREGFDF